MKFARMKREAAWEGMVGVEVLPASSVVGVVVARRSVVRDKGDST